jgi:hypothetical protein
MEAPEVPLEEVQEKIHEEAHHHSDHTTGKWIFGVALSSAFLAALAAVCSLMAGHHEGEAMIEQIRASDQWSYFQAKGIKQSVLSTKMDFLAALGKPVSEEDSKKVAEYKKEQEEIKEQAEEYQKSSEKHLQRHTILARGVTMFQMGIAMGAIAVLLKMRRFWFVSMVFGAVGIYFLALGMI